MKLSERINSIPKKEIISAMIDELSISIAEHKKSYQKNYEKEIYLLDRIITQYYLLSLIIKKPTNAKRSSARALFSTQYLRTISNNFLVIKELFISGLHIQMQLIFRNQLEFVDNLIAFTGDDEFFDRFCTEESVKNFVFISPKPIHSEKSLKKLMKEHNSDGFEDVWKLFKNIKDFMYKELSQTTHGHVVKVALQTFGEDINDKNILSPNSAGVMNPLPITMGILRQCLNYFQITYSLIYIQLEKNSLLNAKNPLFDLTKYYFNNDDFINDE